MESTLLQQFLIALAVGISSGAIASFIILRRMALVGDALSHVALPGIALALVYQIDPFWGLLFFLLGAAWLIWWLETHTALPSDAIVGILFTASIAIGILTIPDHELIESLFGALPEFSVGTLVIFLAAAAGLTAAVFFFSKRFLFSTINHELARIHGSRRIHEFLFLALFAAIVALGIKLVGALLMGALTVIPASIAKNISMNAKTFMLYSTTLGAVIATAGIFLSRYFGFLPGPTIVLVGLGLFLFSLVRASRK